MKRVLEACVVWIYTGLYGALHAYNPKRDLARRRGARPLAPLDDDRDLCAVGNTRSIQSGIGGLELLRTCNEALFLRTHAYTARKGMV